MKSFAVQHLDYKGYQSILWHFYITLWNRGRYKVWNDDIENVFYGYKNGKPYWSRDISEFDRIYTLEEWFTTFYKWEV
jgi:hypothetical protein